MRRNTLSKGVVDVKSELVTDTKLIRESLAKLKPNQRLGYVTSNEYILSILCLAADNSLNCEPDLQKELELIQQMEGLSALDIFGQHSVEDLTQLSLPTFKNESNMGNWDFFKESQSGVPAHEEHEDQKTQGCYSDRGNNSK